MSICLEGARSRSIEYREYHEGGRRVKEYIVKLEMNVDTDKDDPININFLQDILLTLQLPERGGGAGNLGLVLCQTSNPPSCPSLTPPNGKILMPVSNYQGSVAIATTTNSVVAYVTAVDSSTDSYSWNIIKLQWAQTKTVAGVVYQDIAYANVSGNKGSSDIIRITFQITLSASSAYLSGT